MTELVVVLNEDKVSYGERSNQTLGENIEALWSKSDFEAQMNLTVPSEVIYVCYRPSDGLFTRVNRMPDGEPNVSASFKNPGDDPVLSWINDNLTQITRMAEYQFLKSRAIYPGDDFVWDEAGKKWDYVEDPQKEKLDAIVWLRNNGVKISVAFSYVWEALIADGTLDPATMPQSIVNTMNSVISNRNKL